MEKSAKKMIFRIIAIILYGYIIISEIMELINHYRIDFTVNDEIVLVADFIMLIGLLLDKEMPVTIALTGLATANWFFAAKYFRRRIRYGFNVMTGLMLRYYLIYAAACTYILFVHLMHPGNRIKSMGLVIMAHLLLFGCRFLYVSVFHSTIMGVLPVNLMPEHFIAYRAIEGIPASILATLCDGLLATFED